MRRGCKHQRVFARRWCEGGDGQWIVLLGDSRDAHARRCADCNEWLPLGPARDTEQTAIEVRAAEIAADSTVRLPKCSLDQPFEERCERCGWEGFLMKAAEPTANWLAGYLARCIVEHAEPLTLADVKDALAKGAEQRKAAERTMKRSPRR